jgi:DUF177 domain-containing protein
MLSYNVTGLLRSAPGTSRTYPVEVESLDVADDLRLAEPIEGQVRLARTGRSILATAELRTALAETCSRCLRPTVAPVEVTIQEEALPSIDLDSGQPVRSRDSDDPDALRLDEHHELHLEGPVREAISLAEPIAPLCRADCRGLCSTCGADLNVETDHGHDDHEIDPRLARLADFRPVDAP